MTNDIKKTKQKIRDLEFNFKNINKIENSPNI